MNLDWLYKLYAWAIGYMAVVIVALGIIAALAQYVVWLVPDCDPFHHRAAGVVVHALVNAVGGLWSVCVVVHFTSLFLFTNEIDPSIVGGTYQQPRRMCAERRIG